MWILSVAHLKGRPSEAWRRIIAVGKKYSGFTLLEVMIAVAIIAIALTTLLGSQSQSVSMANEAKFNTMAALLAQSKMAEVELAGFENLESDQGDFGENFSGYHWQIKVSRVNFDAFEAVLNPEAKQNVNVGDYLKQVDLAILWGESGQFQYQLRFYSFSPVS